MEKNHEVKSEFEVNLKEILFELKHNWILLAGAAILLGAIAFFYTSFFVTPKYQSTSEMYVLSKNATNTTVADVQVGTYMTRDYIEIVADRPVIDAVIENLGLGLSYKQLAGMIRVNNPENTRIISITITDVDPERAKKIADEMVDVASAFIAAKMDQPAPNVLHYGSSDGGPVSPNVKMSTLLGIVAGLFLAVVAIIMKYLFSDSIMSAEDVERKLGLSVLGMLPMEKGDK